MSHMATDWDDDMGITLGFIFFLSAWFCFIVSEQALKFFFNLYSSLLSFTYIPFYCSFLHLPFNHSNLPFSSSSSISNSDLVDCVSPLFYFSRNSQKVTVPVPIYTYWSSGYYQIIIFLGFHFFSLGTIFLGKSKSWEKKKRIFKIGSWLLSPGTFLCFLGDQTGEKIAVKWVGKCWGDYTAACGCLWD